MHLGRFHATIHDLAKYFKATDVPGRLEQCAAALDQYAATKTPTHLDTFRSIFASLVTAAEGADANLTQPYARQVIGELSIGGALNPELPIELNTIVQERAFDHAGVAADFRALAANFAKKIDQITSIDTAFAQLRVEYEQVENDEAEVGILLPREVVGNSLAALTAEFNQLNKLFRAINELTGAPDYDPKVRTISSSWWQIFLELQGTQVVVWVVAIERIVALFKANLEIKELQQKLSAKDMPKDITDLIENEIDKRVTHSLRELASDLCRDHSQIDDKGRLNEIETQLRQGLYHLAKRINQGSQVEINIAIPLAPEDPPAPPEGEEPNHELLTKIADQRARIAKLRELKTRSQAASIETLKIDGTSLSLLKYFEGGEGNGGKPPLDT